MHLQLENMDAPPQVFELNISGKLFEVTGDILARFPKSRLGKLAIVSSSSGTGTKKTLFFSRPSTPFDDILAYYQTGELHMPINICPKAYKRELDFWELDPDEMQYCCRFKYLTFLDECETISTFQASIEKTNITSAAVTPTISPVKRFRARVWSVIEHEESTVISKVYMWTMIFFVVMSILTLSLGTLSTLRVPLRVCQYRNHLVELVTEGDTGDFDYYGSAIVLMKNVSCNSGMNTVREMAQGLTWIIDRDHHVNNKPTNEHNATPENTDDTDDIHYIEELRDAFIYDHYEYYGEEIAKPQLLQALTEISKLPDITKPHKILIYLDIAPVIVFTIEMILLLATCPNYRRFFTSWMNMLDIVILALVYVGLLLELRFAKFRFSEKGVKILLYLQMFRVLRVLRYIQHVPAVQVLVFTVRTKYKDLGVIIIFILIGVLLFGNFVYFVDDNLEFTDIPTSWWWGIITMTTVGYGDVVPMTSLGKIVGSLCALSGVICLSLTIPIFVNTFISLYDFSNIYEKNLKRKSEKKINLSVQKYEESSHNENKGISGYGTKEIVQSFVGIRVKPANNG